MDHLDLWRCRMDIGDSIIRAADSQKDGHYHFDLPDRGFPGEHLLGNHEYSDAGSTLHVADLLVASLACSAAIHLVDHVGNFGAERQAVNRSCKSCRTFPAAFLLQRLPTLPKFWRIQLVDVVFAEHVLVHNKFAAQGSEIFVERLNKRIDFFFFVFASSFQSLYQLF